MNAQEFCYWLQGYAELAGERPTEAQWATIREHLKLVFTKVTGHEGMDDILDQMRRHMPDAPRLPTGPICSSGHDSNGITLVPYRYVPDQSATFAVISTSEGRTSVFDAYGWRDLTDKAAN